MVQKELTRLQKELTRWQGKPAGAQGQLTGAQGQLTGAQRHVRCLGWELTVRHKEPAYLPKSLPALGREPAEAERRQNRVDRLSGINYH